MVENHEMRQALSNLQKELQQLLCFALAPDPRLPDETQVGVYQSNCTVFIQLSCSVVPGLGLELGIGLVDLERHMVFLHSD